MDTNDLFINFDWEPSYLELIFNEDFLDMTDLWNEEFVTDSELLEMCKNSEIYSPIVQDIMLDEDDLVRAVTKIESE